MGHNTAREGGDIDKNGGAMMVMVIIMVIMHNKLIITNVCESDDNYWHKVL